MTAARGRRAPSAPRCWSRPATASAGARRLHQRWQRSERGPGGRRAAAAFPAARHADRVRPAAVGERPQPGAGRGQRGARDLGRPADAVAALPAGRWRACADKLEAFLDPRWTTGLPARAVAGGARWRGSGTGGTIRRGCRRCGRQPGLLLQVPWRTPAGSTPAALGGPARPGSAAADRGDRAPPRRAGNVRRASARIQASRVWRVDVSSPPSRQPDRAHPPRSPAQLPPKPS